MNITCIEATTELHKNRVAAYCRVSTDMPEQTGSLETQMRYYKEYIEANTQWQFMGIYADPGISGTSAKKRPGFQRMIADAKERKLDIIHVKSISRFARNAAEAQKYVHELRGYGVEIRFERERINSMDTSKDMLFNLLAIVAQDESRSISENVKWRIRKDQARGVHHLGNGRVLGYDELDGKLVPNDKAWIVRRLFNLYCLGMPITQIVSTLNSEGARSVRGGPLSLAAAQGILKNEVYTGDRILQKRAPVDYLTKRPDHTLDYTSYFIADDHEPIIDRKTWEAAQVRMHVSKAEEGRGARRRANSHPLYGALYCMECGAPYKRRTLRGKRGHYHAWNCAERQKGKRGNGCKNVIIREEELFDLIKNSYGADVSDSYTADGRIDRLAIGVQNGDVILVTPNASENDADAY